MTKLCSEKTKQNSKKKKLEPFFAFFFPKKGGIKKNISMRFSIVSSFQNIEYIFAFSVDGNKEAWVKNCI